jgi:hypothetical protein
MRKLRYALIGLLIASSCQASDYKPRYSLFKTALVGMGLILTPKPIIAQSDNCPESLINNHEEITMANQNSIFAPTPIAVAKGGTGNSAALTNGQLWIGNTGNVPTPAALTAGNGISIANAAGSITVTNTFNLPLISAGVGTTTAVSGSLMLISGNPAVIAFPTSPNPGDTYYVTSGVANSLFGYSFTLSASPGQSIKYSGSTFNTSMTTTSVFASISFVYLGTLSSRQIFSVVSTSPGAIFTGV